MLTHCLTMRDFQSPAAVGLWQYRQSQSILGRYSGRRSGRYSGRRSGCEILLADPSDDGHVGTVCTLNLTYTFFNCLESRPQHSRPCHNEPRQDRVGQEPCLMPAI